MKPAFPQRPLSAPIAIAGGGLLGMVLALRLAEAGLPVTLVEAAERTGGLATSDTLDGHVCDRFYHVVLPSDRHTRGLLRTLGLESRLQWGRSSTGFYVDGAWSSMSNLIEFLRFPPLSLIDLMRLGGTIWWASRIRRGEPLEKITAVDWLTRWSGRKVVDTIWRPLLESKLGEQAPQVNAAFIWATMVRMYAARKAGLQREQLGWIEGGYAGVIGALDARLDSLGVKRLTGARIAAISGHDAGARITLTDGAQLDTSGVVSTLPVPVFASVCQGLPDALRTRLSRVLTQGVICPTLLLERPLSPYYITNITDRWVPFTGIIEMSALVGTERFGGRSLVYLPIYLPQDSPRWQEEDASLLAHSIAALERMVPGFEGSQVKASRVARARHVFAVPTLHYSRDVRPALETGVPHVFQLTSAQIVNGTLNVDETIALVETHCQDLIRALTQHAR